MHLVFFLLLYVPEDSNTQYLLDKQLAHYFPSWIVYWDSSTNALRTSQGCLDLKNWYIDFDARVEANLASWLGLRYRNRYHGDYNKHVSNHYFEPFVQVLENLRILLSVAPHYYKGEDELAAIVLRKLKQVRDQNLVDLLKNRDRYLGVDFNLTPSAVASEICRAEKLRELESDQCEISTDTSEPPQPAKQFETPPQQACISH